MFLLLLVIALGVPKCSQDEEGEGHHFVENRTRRDKTDRFVLRFVKPED